MDENGIITLQDVDGYSMELWVENNEFSIFAIDNCVNLDTEGAQVLVKYLQRFINTGSLEETT